MKTKYIFGIALAAGLTFTACNDDDVFINTTPVMDASSVVTGSANPTLTSVELYGTINGLADRSATSYRIGFNYTTSKEALENVSEGQLNMSQTGSLADNQLSAQITDLEPSTFVYYQAYVTLSSTLTFKGEIKSTYTTDAVVSTPALESNPQAFGVSLSCDFDNAPEGAIVGVVVSPSDDQEVLRESGRQISANEGVRSTRGSQSVEVTGLIPSTKYYYAAYMDLGPTTVYGEIGSFTTPAYNFDVDNDLVDLGLPSGLKWAKYNVGATSESELGGLYGFGDVTGAVSSVDPADYALTDTYKTVNDIAGVAYQNRATLPSASDWEELFNNSNVSWTTVDGIAGYKVTGPNGNSIFLPAAGSRTINTVTEVGVKGFYLTGSSTGEYTKEGQKDSNYYYVYQFSNSQNARNTLPVYQAVAARAVSTSRNVPFVAENLYQTWYLDNNQDGMLHVWSGPFTQYGSTDNWGTVTNGENNPYQDIHWEMGLDNGWIGYTPGFDHGYMTLNEDGSVEVGRNKVTESGETYTDVQKGTFTIDADKKTITIDIPVLCADTWLGNTSGTLNILSLNGDGMQIAVPDGDYGYALNYYSDAKKTTDEKIKVQLLCVGGDWAGTWGDVIDAISPEDLDGIHTASYSGAVNGAMVFTLDFLQLLEKYPKAMVALVDIKCDGESISFDPAKLFYGNVENDVNYRIELFNIWGKGSNEGIVDTPFSNAGPVDTDWNFNFAENIEFTYYIATNPTFEAKFYAMNSGWYTAEVSCGYVPVSIVNNKFVAETAQLNVNFTDGPDDWGGGFAEGPRTFYIDVENLYPFFPATVSTLNALKLDGKDVAVVNPDLLVNTSADGAGVKYRFELWNQWDGVFETDTPFGPKNGQELLSELGFENTVEMSVTVTPKAAEVNF